MPMLPSRNYVSDHTLFIRKLIEDKPDLRQKQIEGRQIWWDKTPVELAHGRWMDEGRIAQSAYVYQDD